MIIQEKLILILYNPVVNFTSPQKITTMDAQDWKKRIEENKKRIIEEEKNSEKMKKARQEIESFLQTGKITLRRDWPLPDLILEEYKERGFKIDHHIETAGEWEEIYDEHCYKFLIK